jgi:hypothetical protein
VVDASGNAYVVGNCWNAAHTQSWIGVVKYSSQGDSLAVIDSVRLGEVAFAAVFDDSREYLCVAGAKHMGAKMGFLTAVYDSACRRVWAQTCSLPGADSAVARDVSVDDSSVYVTGSSWKGDSSSCLTLRYSFYGGPPLNTLKYNAGGEFNLGNAVVAAGNGRVYVTGVSGGSTGDYQTLFYSLPDTTPRVCRYDGTGGDDGGFDIAVDDSENVYVTGLSAGLDGRYNFATLKYDSSGLARWVARHDPGGQGGDYREPPRLVVGRGSDWETGHIDVGGTAMVEGQGDNFSVVTYRSSGDSVLWHATYDGQVHGDDRLAGIAVDGTGDVYVVGASDAAGAASDFLTEKLNGTTGDTLWIRRWDGNGRCWDFGVKSVLSPGPGDSCLVGDSLIPSALWANWGSETGTILAHVALLKPNGTVFHARSTNLAIPAHETLAYRFEGKRLDSPGDWSLRCSTYHESDMVRANDVMVRTFRVVGIEESDTAVILPRVQVSSVITAPRPIVIRYALPGVSGGVIEFWNVVGMRLVARGLPPSGAGSVTLDAAELSAGVYILQLRAGDLFVRRKVVVQR